MADFFTDLNNRLQQQAQQGQDFSWQNYRTNEKIKQLAEQRKKKQSDNGNFFTSLIPTAGGTVGSLGGAAAGAALGSVVPGVGTAVGGLLGALLGGAGGSALGKVGENAVEGEKDLSKGVGQEALLGGVTSLPFGAVGKLAGASVKATTGIGKTAARDLLEQAGQKTIPKMAKASQAALSTSIAPQTTQSAKLGKFLESKGGQLMGSQANLTRAEARRIGQRPDMVMGNINSRTGLSNIEDMAAVGGNVTGGNGAYSELVRNAIGNTPGVNIADLRQIGENLIVDKAPLITGAKRKSILAQITNSSVKAHGGAKGSLNPLANPLEAYDVANSFRSMARDIKTGATVSAEDRQLAGVYDNLAKTIEDRLYKAPGLNEGLDLAKKDTAAALTQLAASAPNEAQGKAYQRLAQELDSIKNVKQLRTAQKDFVGLNKIDEATSRAQGGAGAQLGDQMQGLGKVVQRPTNIVAMPLNAATPAVGGTLSKVGRALQGQGQRPQGQGLIGALTRQGVGRVVANTGNTENQVDQLGLTPEDYQTLSAEGYQFDPTTQQPQLANEPMQQPGDFGGTDQNQVAAAMVSALQAGDIKSFSALKDLYDTIASTQESQSSQSNVGKLSAKDFGTLQSGVSSLEALKGLISSDPGVVNRTAIPGRDLPIVGGAIANITGTDQYDTLGYNVADTILRLRTGAQAPESEVRALQNRLMPRAGESAQAQSTKLAQLENIFSQLLGTANAPSAPLSLEDALAGGV